MGVYIKGMEMPFVGSVKTIAIYPDGTVRTRRQDPLPYTAVPVPAHGDLIDRDALEPYILNEHYGYRLVYDEVDVAHAPTIIPAEEGE